MKSFKQLGEEVLNEGGEHYPADEMTMSELKIACYAAQNILAKLEDGAMIQRWQISAIVKAKEELSSVYTSISADAQDEMDDEEAWLNGYDDEAEEGEYVGYEYPSMYGEGVELDEASLLGPKGAIHKAASADQSDREYAAQNSFKISWKAKNIGKKWPGYEKAGFKSQYDFKEETDYKVSVEGLPDMYVKANNPGEVKTNLRKIVKNPEMIKSVDRVTQSLLQKIFRDKAAGKEETNKDK